MKAGIGKVAWSMQGLGWVTWLAEYLSLDTTRITTGSVIYLPASFPGTPGEFAFPAVVHESMIFLSEIEEQYKAMNTNNIQG